MGAFPQMIILDLVSGEAKGVWLKSAPGFSPDYGRDYYMSVQCDEKYIYALYKGEEPHEKATVVHVFDWEGQLLRRIELSHPASSLSLDPVSGMLYTMRYDEEEIYRYSVN